MIYIENTINHPTLQQSALLFMRHYRDSEFLDLVKNVSKFNHTQDSGEVVAKKIEQAALTIKVVPYKTWSPWSKVVAYAEGNTIFVNTRKINLPLADRVENLMHESLHVLNYSHQGNYVTAYNLKTAPFLVGAMFSKYVMSKQ
jgi:hypothetical protein